MSFSFRFMAWWRGLAALLLLGAATAAWAQEDPPGIVARLGAHEGVLSFSLAGDDSWYDAAPNRPLTSGDRVWSDRGARAQLHVGATALYLDESTSLELTRISDDAVRLTLAQGTLVLRVRDEPSAPRIEVDSANLAFVIDQPGQYRFDVDPRSDSTRVRLLQGAGTAYGDNGSALPLVARQQLAVTGRALESANLPPPRGGGAFDAWVAALDRQEDDALAARYVSRAVVGYADLDQYGQWSQEPDYGAVWFPTSVAADWAPYRYGRWENVAPWGWTWIDAAPWGFAPFHYGRWARLGNRWGWVPGSRQARPVYAPALVGFVGGHGALETGRGRDGVGWFPLAPNEPWRPGFRASPRYIEGVNRGWQHGRQDGGSRYRYQQLPDAVTVVPAERFGRGRIGRGDWERPRAGEAVGLPVTGAPRVPLPGRGAGSAAGTFQNPLGRPVQAVPPAAVPPPERWRDGRPARGADAHDPRFDRAPAPRQPPLPGQGPGGRERDFPQGPDTARAQQAEQARQLQLQQQATAQRQARQAQEAQRAQALQQQLLQQQLQAREQAQQQAQAMRQAQQQQHMQQQQAAQQQQQQQMQAQQRMQQLQQQQARQQQALQQQQQLQQQRQHQAQQAAPAGVDPRAQQEARRRRFEELRGGNGRPYTPGAGDRP